MRRQIKEARASKKWSQKDLGDAIGLPQPHVSAIESGKIVPRFDTLIDLLRILDLDLIIIPRALVHAARALNRSWNLPDDEIKPLYALDDNSEEDL